MGSTVDNLTHALHTYTLNRIPLFFPFLSFLFFSFLFSFLILFSLWTVEEGTLGLLPLLRSGFVYTNTHAPTHTNNTGETPGSAVRDLTECDLAEFDLAECNLSEWDLASD